MRRATITSDGEHVGSVYNFINLACNKRGRFAYKVWERLISENSVYRDELYKLFTLEYVKGLSGQIDDLSHTQENKTSSDTRYDPARIAEALDDF